MPEAVKSKGDLYGFKRLCTPGKYRKNKAAKILQLGSLFGHKYHFSVANMPTKKDQKADIYPYL